MPRTVFRLQQKVSKDKSSRRTCVGRLFQRRGLAAANARSVDIMQDNSSIMLKFSKRTYFLMTVLDWLIDWVKVLHPTRHKIGHFGDVLLSQPVVVVLKKLNPTQQKQTTQEQNSLICGYVFLISDQPLRRAELPVCSRIGNEYQSGSSCLWPGR